MAENVEQVRREWEEGHRRLEAYGRGEPTRYRQLLVHVELLIDELRRRVGQTFTLADLVREYYDAERWAREVISVRAPSPGWALTLSVVEDAAFHAYQRGASDYRP